MMLPVFVALTVTADESASLVTATARPGLFAVLSVEQAEAHRPSAQPIDNSRRDLVAEARARS
jgi:hypothetical protein